MAVPKTGVKIMTNNIHPKTGSAQPHSKLKPSGQTLNPFPEIMQKKIKKKKRKEPINSETVPLHLNSNLSEQGFHKLVAR